MTQLFKVDENLPVEVVEALRNAGHDAVSVVDQGLAGARDPKVAAISKQEGRSLVTLDVDFTDIRTYSPSEYPGIVVLRLHRQDKRSVLEAVSRFVELLSRLPVQGRLWIVEERRIRSRGANDPTGDADAS